MGSLPTEIADEGVDRSIEVLGGFFFLSSSEMSERWEYKLGDVGVCVGVWEYEGRVAGVCVRVWLHACVCRVWMDESEAKLGVIPTSIAAHIVIFGRAFLSAERTFCL